MSAVVNDLAGASHGTGFEEVYTETVSPVDEVVGFNAILVEVHLAGFCDIVFGHAGNELSVEAVVGERNGNVCFTTAEGSGKFFGL